MLLAAAVADRVERERDRGEYIEIRLHYYYY